MLTNYPQLDYLRLTTWDDGVSFSMNNAFWARCDRDILKAARRLGYKGLTDGSWFYGRGMQKHYLTSEAEPHYMLEISGPEADAAGNFPNLANAKCTRVDLQITLERPAHWDYEYISGVWRGAGWGRGGQRGITLITSDTGQTLYVGSRKSDRFIRFYDKKDDRGRRFVRFEVEYKGRRARAAWSTGLDPQRIRALLLGECEQLPPASGLDAFAYALDGTAEHLKPEVVEESTLYFVWARCVITGSFAREIHDHEHGGRLRELVYTLAREAMQVDGLKKLSHRAIDLGDDVS